MIWVIIPAFNEEKSIGLVLSDLPREVDEIVVIDNGSTDETAAEAKKGGATVLYEPRKGYGFACLAGIEHLKAKANQGDIVVFLDGDYSDYPEELTALITPILQQKALFVLGTRVTPQLEKGALTPQQRFGNELATTLMKWIYGSTFTDLGPFRAIEWKTLMQLNMNDKTYGWTVEMQLKILKKAIPYLEVPVRYRPRIGVSKVSGTLKGTLMAGYKILSWIFIFSLKR
ncbi:MAG: glycosyltransferase family 2 protein [Flavobacteriaceae bacterium]|jgi:glycosyltransferase involved in cell wall biosynthesis